jgi:hypothetical protein
MDHVSQRLSRCGRQRPQHQPHDTSLTTSPAHGLTPPPPAPLILQGPCQHNFCLACFKRWLGQGKKSCPTCRAGFSAKFCENPRINTLLTYAIRCAKQGIKTDAPKAYNRIAGG